MKKILWSTKEKGGERVKKPKVKEEKTVEESLVKQLRADLYRLLPSGRNPLAAFWARPKINFETQDSKEEVILLLRRHWITNLSWLGVALILILAPLVLKNFPFFSLLPLRFQLAALVGWYLLVAAFIIEQALSWFFNVYIITDERIVDIDFKSLIYKEISDAEIGKIQDVTLKMGGVLRTVFNFGTVFIQTAAEKPQFEFEDIPNPALVVKVLEKLRQEEHQEELEGRVR